MKATAKREDFFANTTNKSQFIAKLSECLLEDKQEVTKSKGDADTEVVRVALQVNQCL